MAWSSRSRRSINKYDTLYIQNNPTGEGYTLMQAKGNGLADHITIERYATWELASDAKQALELKQLKDRATKSKRQVFPTDEIPHLWAHQVVPEARNSGKNLYFEGATIFSYGSHFPIARHYQAGKRKAILLTTKKYSVTTAKHIHMVRLAIPENVTVFHVPYVVQGFALDFHRANVRSYVNLADDFFNKAKKSIVLGESYLAGMENAFNEAKAYIKFFNLKGFKLALPANKKQIAELREKMIARVNKRAAKIAWELANPTEAQRIKHEAFAKRNTQAIAKFEKEKQEWFSGERISFPINPAFKNRYGFQRQNAELRIKDGMVETSQGARVPIDHAWRGLRLVRAVMHSGKEYKRNGHTEYLGPYAVDSISADGTLRAGCHVITWDAIARIAPALDRLQEIEMIANSGKEVK